MTTNYNGRKTVQRRRYETLCAVREVSGDRNFSDFVIDVLAEGAANVRIDDFGSLYEVWLKKRLTAAREIHGVGGKGDPDPP